MLFILNLNSEYYYYILIAAIIEINSNQGDFMKRLIKLFIILSTFLTISACGNNIVRSERTFTLLQENITSIVNELNEIQLQESYIQQDFESTLNASDDLSAFKNMDADIYKNLKQRKSHLDNLNKLNQELIKLQEEISNENFSNDEDLEKQVNSLTELLSPLRNDLQVYIDDYLNSLQPEKETYQSVANNEIDYHSFANVFDNVNTLNQTNLMNLEKVLGYFENINANIIDIKVYITNKKNQ